MKHHLKTKYVLCIITVIALFSSINAQAKGPSWKKLNNRCRNLLEKGEFKEAETVCTEAVNKAKDKFGPDHDNTGDSIRYLAIAHLMQKDYSRALPLLKGELERIEKLGNPDEDSYRLVLNNLGSLYSTLGQDEEAETLLEKSLAISERLYGENDPKTAMTLENLGQAYINQGKFNEAEKVFLRALSIWEPNVEPDSASLVISLANLGDICNKLGRHSEALAYQQRLLKIYDGQLGENHPMSSYVLCDLCQTCISLGELPKAEEYCNRALEAANKPDEAEVKNKAEAIAAVATLKAAQGNNSEAGKLYDEAIKLLEDNYGKNYRKIADVLILKSDFLEKTGRKKEAKAARARAEEIKETSVKDYDIDLHGE